MPQFFRNHIVVNSRTLTLPYTSNLTGRTKIVPRHGLDRQIHGTSVRTQFATAVSDFRDSEDNEFVYIVFKSALDFLLDIDKLDKGSFRLASYKEIQQQDADGTIHRIYEATVYLNKQAISAFLAKVEAYLTLNTPKGNPKNLSLIANIDEIRAATLESFWQEPELPFPAADEITWWEIWLNREQHDSLENPIAPLLPVLNSAGLETGGRVLKFPEHVVFLIRGTAAQLSTSLLYTDRLAEIRKPRETTDYFTYLDRQQQDDWIVDLNGRVINKQANNEVAICLLDTGVTLANPLLEALIPEENLDAVEPVWTRSDTHPQGHGTAMAGLALYGDLVDAFVSQESISINHHLESVKLIEQNHAHDPVLYGAVTQEAIARAEVLNPIFKRIVCMAVTVDDGVYKGRPSSWSSAIDQSVFGSVEENNQRTVFFVSAGNLAYEDRITYPLINEDSSIHDPAQSFNAITVGSYTLKDQIELSHFPGAELLAGRGRMSPCSTTSFKWHRDWCRKPDIVMEGGNQAIHNGGVIDPDSLQLLSTARGGIGRSWLTSFGDTSASTALASKFAAELYCHYPTFWPETIRGLIVHSCDWTPAMLANRRIDQLTAMEKAKVMAFVGYGVPNMHRAKYSANNSLSLIAQRVLKPFKIEDSSIKTDSFHLLELPWPAEVLQELLHTNVTFKVTLSYFIEPNPGNKQYDLATSYRSHGLRFKMIDSNESDAAFRARVSKAMKQDGYEAEGAERWVLGSQLRDKGSIHKDIWVGTAAELAAKSKIAVYPVGGWWKTRKKHERFQNSVRYSLIMTIDTPDIDIDIFTPVENIIQIQI
jgi:hypothetical protein